MKNVLAWALFVALATATGRLALPQAAELVPPDKSAEVYKAVILFQIKSWDLAANSYCIKINSHDADKALLKQLQSPRVMPASACKKVDRRSAFMRVVNKKTRKNSVIFDLEAIRWKSETEVEVDGGYVCASLCMAGGVYHAVYDKSGWRVVGFDAQVMS
jgi:hypothetical protein